MILNLNKNQLPIKSKRFEAASSYYTQNESMVYANTTEKSKAFEWEGE
jgi:hypothetical protein